jgi:hypothetical protein
MFRALSNHTKAKKNLGCPKLLATNGNHARPPVSGDGSQPASPPAVAARHGYPVISLTLGGVGDQRKS